MKSALALLIALAASPLGAAWASAGYTAGAAQGVFNPAEAQVDYKLKCQGCHRADGAGDATTSPPLKGEVARFLAAPGGREFLARVPGVASVDLDDRRLAQVLNWTLFEFDRANVPTGFKPYTAAEIGRLRQAPLRLDRAAARAAVIARLEGS